MPMENSTNTKKHSRKRRLSLLVLSMAVLGILPGQNQADTVYADSVIYYTKYKDKFVFGLHQFTQQFNFVFTQNNISDSLGHSKMDYNADANIATGVFLAWEKIAFGLTLRTTPPENNSKKGQTTYRNLRLSIAGNKWLLETSYRRFKGFYELQSARVDTLTYTPETPYFLNPSMQNRDIKAKFFWFTNHKKFSYKAAYNGVHRQLKSAISPVFTANIHHQSLSTDTSFITPLAWSFWPIERNVHKINFTSLSAGGGIAGTLVIFKRVYANLVFTLNVENQFRTYHQRQKPVEHLTYMSLSGDFRASIGYNGNRFYLIGYSMNDFFFITRNDNVIVSKLLSGGVALGYRFNVKERPFMKKVKSSKIYNLI